MEILVKISYFLILGKPIVFYLGILTFISLIFTATIGYLSTKGSHIIPFKWHARMARVTIALAIIHGILAMSAYF